MQQGQPVTIKKGYGLIYADPIRFDRATKPLLGKVYRFINYSQIYIELETGEIVKTDYEGLNEI